MKKVLTLGGAMRDVFLEYDPKHVLHMDGHAHEKSFITLEEGTKIDVKTIAYHVGGGAANAAVSFKRLGFEVEAFFKLGQDHEGDYILNHVRKEGVNTSHVVRTDTDETGVAIILPCPEGNKVALVYRGANLTLQQKEVPWSSIEQVDQLYITSLGAASAQILLPVVMYAKKHHKAVAVNPGTKQLQDGALLLRDALPYIDVLILNSEEAQQFMLSLGHINQDTVKPSVFAHHATQIPELLQSTQMSDYFREVLSRGPTIVVVTNGAEGVYVATASTVYFYPSRATHVVSTLGAGDAFGSCFVACLLQGDSIERALVAGTINSSAVIEHVGTQVGLLTQQDLEERLQKADMSLVQTFPL
jgi:sugar/nucleoside kinase (ribokinase family)